MVDEQHQSPESEQRDEKVLDRELSELTGELRTVIPGVSVLFAFLLTVPFSSGFPTLTGAERGSYFLAFLSAALALVFLIGESAYHRVRGKPYHKGRLIRTASRQAVAALVLLGITLAAVVFLVTSLVFSTSVSAPVTAGITALAAVTWFGLPLWRRQRGA